MNLFLIPDLQPLSRKEGNGIDFACGNAPAAKVIWSGWRVCKRSPCETGCDLTARERGETQVKRLAWELCCRLITKMGTHPLGLQLSLHLQNVIGCQVQNTVPLLGTWAIFSLAQLCGLEETCYFFTQELALALGLWLSCAVNMSVPSVIPSWCWSWRRLAPSLQTSLRVWIAGTAWWSLLDLPWMACLGPVELSLCHWEHSSVWLSATLGSQLPSPSKTTCLVCSLKLSSCFWITIFMVQNQQRYPTECSFNVCNTKFIVVFVKILVYTIVM